MTFATGPQGFLAYAGFGVGLAAIAMGAACGGTTDASSDSRAASTTEIDGGSSSKGSSSGASSDDGSAERSGDSGNAGTAGGERPPTLILIASGGASGEVGADVTFPDPGAGLQQTCTSPLVVGACQLTSCQGGGIGGPLDYNFGPISVSVGTTTVQLTDKNGGYGTVDFPPSVTLSTGGVMTFRGGNNTGVPTFAVPVTIPGVAVITSPAPMADGGSTIVDTSRDLPVHWLPIPIGQIHFGLDAESAPINGVDVSIACTFDGASGAGVVSQTLISSLKQMAGAVPASATVSSELDTTTVVDGFTIVAQSYQTSPTAVSYFNVTLQ
jgi:hypothetical protein